MKKKDIKVIDGKCDNPKKTTKQSLDSIWGYDISKYKCDDIAEYDSFLVEANTADLQSECLRLGLLPNISRNVMIERLRKLFNQTKASQNNDVKPVKLDVKISKKAQDIMSEAKSRYA